MDKVCLPEMQKGNWKIEHFTTDRTDLHSLFHGRAVPVGETFTRLMRGGTLVMSDTPAEMRDHTSAVHYARGNCLLNGLGIGMVLKNILKKPEVESVVVVEISQDLIDLVAPFYSDPRVEYVCCDAFEYRLEKGKSFDMVWHDIWDSMCADNLPEMTRLHRKYAKKTRWQGSWGRGQCMRLSRSGW